jgi:S-adenosylmethionine hydrolase
MKGVISGIAPEARIIDLSHAIPQGEIQRAAVQFWMAQSYFPDGTIFLCVVDPGVGTERRGIIVNDERFTYIGPDNGVFTYCLQHEHAAYELSNPRFQQPQLSSTFHGRDIFAPAAAYAANGAPAEDFGAPLRDLVLLPGPLLVVEDNQVRGEIIYSDQFGNLLTSLGKFLHLGNKRYQLESWLPTFPEKTPPLVIQSEEASIELPDGGLLSWINTFAEIPPGECGALVGSTGLLEIAAFNRSAQEMIKLSMGDPVTLLF